MWNYACGRFVLFWGVGWGVVDIYEYSELANFANGENDEYSFLISARANLVQETEHDDLTSHRWVS